MAAQVTGHGGIIITITRDHVSTSQLSLGADMDWLAVAQGTLPAFDLV